MWLASVVLLEPGHMICIRFGTQGRVGSGGWAELRLFKMQKRDPKTF
jgi:hypothetical protein